MAPVSAQNDKCESIAILSMAHCLLHVGERIDGWLVPTTVGFRFGAQGHCEHDCK